MCIYSIHAMTMIHDRLCEKDSPADKIFNSEIEPLSLTEKDRTS